MGYKSIIINIPTVYSDENVRSYIRKQLNISTFTFQIEKKSLDARKKRDLHWQLSVNVFSSELKGIDYKKPNPLEINYKKRNKTVMVIGSGPAGFFAAYVLQLAGFDVTIIERGSDVEKRTGAIKLLDSKGEFSEMNNYAFGEGGAGTFSDGKLTSRSKHISAERQFIISEYVKAGAPEEILFMAHPHVGTENLKLVVVNLRKQFIKNGGKFLFNTKLEDLEIDNGKIIKINCKSEEYRADYVVLATGHSAYETYRMLINRGVNFVTKNFAIGHRIEHEQTLINKAQWGFESVPGLKAAEYRLTSRSKSGLPVYTFCMCPGGNVVAAAAYTEKSVVNGMSYFSRNGRFSNAGCVVGVHPDMLLQHHCKPLEILDWMDKQEEEFYKYSNSYEIPANMACDYMKMKESKKLVQTSYSLGLQSAPLFNMLPEKITNALSEGIAGFSRQLKGFESGMLMGFESKTSSPIQVSREKDGRCTGFENLYFVGEGSGFAGGIISSAADGIKCALSICSE